MLWDTTGRRGALNAGTPDGGKGNAEGHHGPSMLRPVTVPNSSAGGTCLDTILYSTYVLQVACINLLLLDYCEVGVGVLSTVLYCMSP